MESKIVYDMPAHEYHAVPAISSSILKRLYVSFPKKIHECPFESTDAMDSGTAFHSYLLNPETFHTKYAILPDKVENWSTVAGKIEKAKHNEIRNLNCNKDIISSYTMQQIEAAYAEFRKHPYGAEIAGRIASMEAKTEVSLFWDEEREDGTTFPCKARLDILDKIQGRSAEGCDFTEYVIRDPKTTRSANPKKFQWDIRPTKEGLNYWIQAGWYYRGAKKCGLHVSGFEFIAIELEKSYGISFHGLDEAELDSIQEPVLRLAQQWDECQVSGKYPNYPATRHMIALGDNDAA